MSMSGTEISLDPRIMKDFLPPEGLPPRVIDEESTAVAPWLDQENDEPPTPPPKQTKFNLRSKTSFPSFSVRQGSVSTLSSRGRPSESRLRTESFASTRTEISQAGSSASARKVRPFNIPNLLKKRSHGRLTIDPSERSIHTNSLSSHAPPVPQLDASSFISSFASPAYPISATPPPTSSRRSKAKLKQRAVGVPPVLPPKHGEPELTLDTNLQEMEGIIDLTARPSTATDPMSGSFSSVFDSSMGSSNFSYGDNVQPASSSPSNAMFSNPFLPGSSSSSSRHKTHNSSFLSFEKISPRTASPPAALVLQNPLEALDGTVLWKAPDSWAVEQDEEEPDDYSSSEESVTSPVRPMSTGPTATSSSKKSKPYRTSTRLKQISKSTSQPQPEEHFRVRIYRANNAYHVAAVPLHVTVASLAPVLNSKLLLEQERETHRLYLKERGRERMLTQTEKPANIVRRRLEQAGYDLADGLDLLGAEDITFLMKFVYKSQLLGPTEEDLTFDAFEHINLTGRSLRAIPVVLHTHADLISTLNLSRNPMLEIPLDFVQSCTTLRELRLSNMAMKRVPHSVRHCVTLFRLDLSCNRIADLNEAGLDQIPKLATLNVQNNRMEKLPWYFPRLRMLRHLNISNNKFKQLPNVVCEIISLVDLDISFNMITELPGKIGQLRLLDRLIIVGNQVSRFPDECRGLISLRDLDCRRNNISDLSVVCMLPKIETLRADHDAIHALDLSLGPSLKTLDASHNDITRLTLVPGPEGCSPYALTSLDISHAKLSSLDEFALGQLSSLETLKLDHNSFRYIPESLGDLSQLRRLSCSDNALDALPLSIGRLQRLEVLDAHNNSLTELPVALWNCASLCQINVTSNQLGIWHDPPSLTNPAEPIGLAPVTTERKTSTAGSIGSQSGRALPPLAHSLERLYLGENNLTDEVLHPLTILKELHVLNLSFNDIQEIPSTFFRNLSKLEELYLSGNKLTSIPTEDLHRMTRLSVLFLNGNKLQTLPHELGKVQSLAILDVGSNVLKYNINNWQFDWNWNFNSNLKYLNLSGNKRLEIKPDPANKGHHVKDSIDRKILADFSSLAQLRVLGLMDVTTTFAPNIPDDNEERRVRTSLSEVNTMAYGIADHLGGNDQLNMLDLVQPLFRDQKDEAIFAMFGLAQPSTGSNRLSKFLHDNFVGLFSSHLDALDKEKNEGVPDALRRSFLRLNKNLHDELYNSAGSSRKMSQASASTAGASLLEQSSIRSGASGIVLYIAGKTMYVANAGNALAVVSRQGTSHLISRKHDPFDRRETERIRAAEGWVSPKGFVNDEIDVSRSFGFYHLLPVVNARPDIITWQLSELDEFVIIGNRGLWDYVSYQTAVDIARSERNDPMIAAQKLRDFAISYGAKGSMMIMVICVADLFNPGRERQPTLDCLVDYEPQFAKRKTKQTVLDPQVNRLPDEIQPPVGHVAIVFTDIRNSTHLWEVNGGMQTAMRLHNTLLRRQLRLCRGYEVKTEGDSFICSFTNALSALWWCLTVQVQLLYEAWPLEILECEDGKPIYDADMKLVARGLSVRMGIHCGTPLCEIDPVIKRMDYLGPMVNRSARINSCAAGGEIMCSAEIVKEINARITESGPPTDYSDYQPPAIVDAIRNIGIVVMYKGEFKLKGLEVPDHLSLVYPLELAGREGLEQYIPSSDVSTSKVQFSTEQMEQLGLLCLRLEALSSSRIFRVLPQRKASTSASEDGRPREDEDSNIMYGDPTVLLPVINDKLSDAELMAILDSFSIRIENSLVALGQKHVSAECRSNMSVLASLDERTLRELLSIFQAS